MDIRDEAIGAHLRGFQAGRRQPSCRAALRRDLGARPDLRRRKSTSSGCSTCSSTRAKAGARKVIFASSGATFGTPEQLADHRRDAAAPHLAVRHHEDGRPNTICASIEAKRDLDFTALRYGNVYGPRQDPNGEAGVISIFIGKFLAREGGAHRLGRRADARLRLRRATSRARTSRRSSAARASCYVIGTGVKTSVNDDLSRARRAQRFRSAGRTRAAARAGDARDAQFDASRARAELGWTPTTPLPDGIARDLRATSSDGALCANGAADRARPRQSSKRSRCSPTYLRALDDADLARGGALLHRQPVRRARPAHALGRRTHDRRGRAARLGLRRRGAARGLSRDRRSRRGARAARAPAGRSRCSSARSAHAGDARRFCSARSRRRRESARNRRREAVLERILRACDDPLDATYVIKIVTGDLRVGLREGLVLDAIARSLRRRCRRRFGAR